MKKEIFFKLQLKRAFKIYPAILLITVIIIGCIGVTASLIFAQNNNDANKKKISLGIVGSIEDTNFDLGIYALQNMDSSRFFVDIKQMTEEEANEALMNREIEGYVLVPENFVKGIYYGDNYPAQFVTLYNPEGLGTILAGEITDVISGFLIEAQNGLYTMQFVAEEYGSDKNMGQKVKDLNLRYIDVVLSRSDIYNIDLLGVSDRLSMGGYYVCSLILFFLLIWGISCNKLLSEKNMTLSRLSNRYGISVTRQMACEYASYLIITLLTLVLMAFVFGMIVWNIDVGIPELQSVTPMECVGFVILMLPAIVMITLMQILLYELVPGTVGSVMLQFLVSVGLGYISGCFYPNYFFPESVQKVAEILPSGVAFSYIKHLMSNAMMWKDFVLTMGYAVVFAVLAVMVRKGRITGDKR